MAAYRLYQVDVFTRDRFRGNPAGVVPEAEGLSDEQMQAIARELNNPETIFVFPPRSADHDVWVRIFSPTTEIPIAGHPTLAAHYVRALEGGPLGAWVRQASPGGTWRVSVEKEANGYVASAIQEPVELGPIVGAADRDRLMNALGLGTHELDERCPVQIVSTGHSKVIFGVRSRATLNRLAPDMEQLAKVSREIGQDGIFLFTLDVDDDELLTECRMFAPAVGIPEDPVTGSGQGPLGAYVVHNGLAEATNGTTRFRSLQGRKLGRPGVARITVNLPKGRPESVTVGGYVVPVFRTEIVL